MEFYKKQVKELSMLDVIRMSEQNILEELAIKKVVEILHEDPLTFTMLCRNICKRRWMS